MLEKSSIEKKACSKNLPPTNFDQSLQYLSRKKHRHLDYALERKSLDLSWKGLRVKKKKIACRGEQNRFPRFLATEIKQRIRVIVEYVSRTSVSRTHGWFIPHLFRIDVERPHHESSGGFNSRASVGVTGGRPSVPHHWGQRSTWVFRFLPNRTFCFRHLLESLFENFRHEKCFKHRRSDDCNWANVIYTVLFFFLFFFFRPPRLNRPSSFFN